MGSMGSMGSGSLGSVDIDADADADTFADKPGLSIAHYTRIVKAKLRIADGGGGPRGPPLSIRSTYSQLPGENGPESDEEDTSETGH
mmetsp:Transcript_22279/g.48253  ORF Transcript_22279/g.48253 Transcript_22279/m.48253 type:complete len:87 (+) Transcript_22279:3-263(+)